MIRTLLLAGAASLALSGAAHAAIIVDTGTPGSGAGNWSLYNNGAGSFQYLAARFTLSGTTTLTDLEGFMTGNGGTLHIGIASDGNDIPNGTLFTQQVGTVTGAAQWQGLHGVNWVLGPGNYWIFFNVAIGAGDSFAGSISAPAPNPLVDEAYFNESTSGDWRAYDALDLAVRISSADGVPEPASWALSILGLGLAGAVMRRSRYRVSFA